MSVWQVQTAAIIHPELKASIPNTYSVILPFTCYMVHFTLIFPYVCIIYPALRVLFLPAFPSYLIDVARCIYFHLLPTPPGLIFFHFHVCNLGLPPPTIPLLLISSPKGPVSAAVHKPSQNSVPNVKSHFKSTL